MTAIDGYYCSNCYLIEKSGKKERTKEREERKKERKKKERKRKEGEKNVAICGQLRKKMRREEKR